MKVFHSVHLLSLFAKVILNASWLVYADTSSVNDRVRLEEGPQKVICDLTLLKKRIEAFGGRLVGFFDEIEQQIKMQKRRIVKGSVVASIRLEIGEVVEEQVLFDLDIVSNYSDSGLLREAKGSCTEGFSSRRLMPLTSRSTDRRTSRNPADLMSMWSVDFSSFLSGLIVRKRI
jgi:hypothetical protein